MKFRIHTSPTRRQFIKSGMIGLTGAAVGSSALSLFSPSSVRAEEDGVIRLGMTVADAEMVDGTAVPHWVYTVEGIPTLPGPAIFAFENEDIQFAVTNNIPDGRARRFAIVGNDFLGNPFALVQQTSDILPGETGSLTIAAGSLPSGTYLYKDPTLDPVSRVLGLHGVLIVLPGPLATNPYGTSSTPNVTALFNAFGVGVPRDPAAYFPGQSWLATTDLNPDYHMAHTGSDHHHHEQFIEHPNGPQSPVLERFLYRSRIMLHHSIDPDLNRDVITLGNSPDPATVKSNFLPQYFSVNGRQGAFAMHAPDIIPMGAIGQPHVVRLLNAGLASHSPHLHGNHFYVISVNNVVGGGGVYFGNQEGDDNILFLDSVTLGPEDRIDWAVPFIRPPDIPRVVGQDGLLVPLTQLIPQELQTVFEPNPEHIEGGRAGVPQNPLSYPMHSHMELDQTAAGGNYPQGAIAGWEITGEFDEDFGGHEIPVASAGSVPLIQKAPQMIAEYETDTQMKGGIS